MELIDTMGPKPGEVRPPGSPGRTLHYPDRAALEACAGREFATLPFSRRRYGHPYRETTSPGSSWYRIWFDPREHANDLHEIIVGDIPMPAGTNLLELYLRVIPALPMQYEAYCLAFTGGYNLFQSDPKEAFLVLRQTVWIIPEAGEIPRERQAFLFLCVGEWALATLLQRHELGFNLRLRGQRLVPAAF